jgi:NTE family protein
LGDRRIEDLDRRFTAVATEIGSGHEVWLTRGRLADAIRASYALPGIFKPVKIDGRWLFDGALVNPIPVSVCRALGARYVIAVNLNYDISSRSAAANAIVNQVEHEETAAIEEPTPSEKTGIGARWLLTRQLFGRGDDAPGISTVMVDALNIVQDRIARSRLAGDPPDALISPRLQGIGLFDFHRAEDAIARGETAARREADDIARELKLRRDVDDRLHAHHAT